MKSRQYGFQKYANVVLRSWSVDTSFKPCMYPCNVYSPALSSIEVNMAFLFRNCKVQRVRKHLLSESEMLSCRLQLSVSKGFSKQPIHWKNRVGKKSSEHHITHNILFLWIELKYSGKRENLNFLSYIIVSRARLTMPTVYLRWSCKLNSTSKIHGQSANQRPVFLGEY